MSRIFQNAELLEESTKVEVDSSEVSKLESKIATWSSQPENKLIAYLGNFGSGKSSTLESVKNSTKEKYYWLNFEAWRYPDRQQIWDGFVIEVINKLKNNKKDEPSSERLLKQLTSVADRIEAVAPFSWRRIGFYIAITAFLVAIWLGVSWLVWSALHQTSSTDTRFFEALIKYSSPLLFVVLAFLGITRIWPKAGSRPLRRVFELEGALYNILTKQLDKPLIIAIEDVDRSKDGEGLVFMETLRHFLKDVWVPEDKGKPIIVVAPQQYSSLDIFIHGYERSIKIYDLPMFFGRSRLNQSDVVGLVNNLQIVSEYKDKLSATIQELTNSYGDQTSMRKLKFMLREMDDFCDANPTANPSIALILIFAQNTIVEKSGQYRGSEYLDGRHNVHNNHPSHDGYEWHVFVDLLYAISGDKLGNVTMLHVEYRSLEEEIEIQRPNPYITDQVVVALDEKYKELIERV